MPDKPIVPTLGANSFSCPYCDALSHQTWFRPFLEPYEKDRSPTSKADAASIVAGIRSDRNLQDDGVVIAHWEFVASGRLFRYKHEQRRSLDVELENASFSLCFSCGQIAVWVSDNLLYPTRSYTFKPHSDIPGELAPDFKEAADIVGASPRAAAALLRLCIQKLMPLLGEKGQNINDDIASLVQKGLNPSIQQALDFVRVIGNNAVHPGEIDLKDDKGTATTLFGLVNLIVEKMIAEPKHIQSLYEGLPASSRAAIQKRDKKPGS